MKTTADQLKKGEKALIVGLDPERVPLKLLEMGCLPGHELQLVQVAPLGDPLLFDINGSRLAIRRETAREIEIERLKTS